MTNLSMLSLSPKAHEEERALVGSLLLDPLRVPEVLGLVDGRDFFDNDLATVYTCIRADYIEHEDIDVIRISRAVDALGGIMGDTSTPVFLAALSDLQGVTEHARYYAKLVRETGGKRRLVAKIHRSLQAISDTSLGEIVGEINQACDDGGTGGDDSRAATHIGDSATEAFDNLLRASESPGIDGVPTGFAHLDNKLGGLRGRELTVLAARPGMGKTSLGIAFSANMAVRSNLKVLFISLEMTKRELSERLLCSETMANSHSIRRGNLEDITKKRLLHTVEQLKNSNLSVIDNSSMSVEEIAELSKHVQRVDGLDVVIVDYLQIIAWKGDSALNREQQVTKTAEALKEIARSLDIPVLCLAQINRQSDHRQDSRPKISDLRESGGIEQAADNVLMLHAPNYHDKDQEDEQLVTCYIEKQRNGPTGEVKLGWLATSTLFFEPKT